MSDNTRKDALLRQAFALSDEMAWDNLVDSNPAAAEAVEALIAEGLVEPDDLRQYAVEQNYLEVVGTWLAHAAAHIQRHQVAKVGDADRPTAPAGDSAK